jgi:KDO2-lipid IV(A) lauroyltransferase
MLHALSFYLFYFVTRTFAFLPLRVQYIFSDICYLVLYYIVRYRRQVVATNLRNSFPEKTHKELKTIEKKFYKHFCDIFIEQLYLFYASEKQARRMCKFTNIDIFEKYYTQGKSVIVAGGHYCNWEILGLFALYLKYITLGVYKPLANKRFENFINKARSKFGGITVPMNDTARLAITYANEGKLFFLGLITDQTPAYGDIRYWTTFLNQDTPVFLGVEKIARKTNQPVFFCNMRKIKRGQYEVTIELITENPRDTRPYEITEMHVRALEKLIREAPEYWLWSHRRWKHRRPDNYKPL